MSTNNLFTNLLHEFSYYKITNIFEISDIDSYDEYNRAKDKNEKYIYNEIEDLNGIKEFMNFFRDDEANKTITTWREKNYNYIPISSNKTPIDNLSDFILLEYEYLRFGHQNNLVDELLVRNLEKFGQIINPNKYFTNITSTDYDPNIKKEKKGLLGLSGGVPPKRYILLNISKYRQYNQLNNVISQLKKQQQYYKERLDELGCKVKQQNK